MTNGSASEFSLEDNHTWSLQKRSVSKGTRWNYCRLYIFLIALLSAWVNSLRGAWLPETHIIWKHRMAPLTFSHNQISTGRDSFFARASQSLKFASVRRLFLRRLNEPIAPRFWTPQLTHSGRDSWRRYNNAWPHHSGVCFERHAGPVHRRNDPIKTRATPALDYRKMFRMYLGTPRCQSGQSLVALYDRWRFVDYALPIPEFSGLFPGLIEEMENQQCFSLLEFSFLVPSIQNATKKIVLATIILDPKNLRLRGIWK